jgi:hypothetical protein
MNSISPPLQCSITPIFSLRFALAARGQSDLRCRLQVDGSAQGDRRSRRADLTVEERQAILADNAKFFFACNSLAVTV